MPLLLNPKILFLTLALCLSIEAPNASAQVVNDRSLPEDTRVTPRGNTIEITGGTRTGRNLFHSFEQFSVPKGQAAFFNNDLAIDNIISRVTGGSLSRIEGLIQANGTANLFLLNPNGIIFGQNASLNIGGSFIGSTANSLRFANGAEFSAVNSQTSPLLTIGVPVGLQYGSNPGQIRVQGSGHNLFLNSPTDPSVNRTNRPPGLQVAPGQTLALVGGNVSLQGGNLTAADGRIELGSVGSGEQVSLTPVYSGWRLGYERVERFQEIQFSHAASLEASGDQGGRIQVQGRLVTLTGNSAIMADTLGNGAGGSLTIRATDAVRLSGSSVPPSGNPPSSPFISRISTDVAPGATGQGGTLTIATQRLQISNGAQVSSGTFSTGNAGLLRVNAKDLIISGESLIGPSGLFTSVDVGAIGNGGNLTVIADRLRITNGAQIAASTFGAGDAGALRIQATDIELIGTSSGGNSSGLFANVEANASGNSRNLTIATDRLRVADGAQIAASTFGAGDAGTLTVQAEDVDLSGTSSRGVPSGLFATVEMGAGGRGGDLTVSTDRLQVSNGAQIAASTLSRRDAGDLTVRAESVEVSGGALRGPSSLATASAAAGNGGNVVIETDRLRLVNGGQIATATAGSGDAGNLIINASEQVEIDGTTEFGASGLFASAVVEGGAGGDLSVTTDRLIVQNGATISVSNFSSSNSEAPPGQGAVGNLSLNANDILLNNQGTLTANSAAGDRGNITLQSDNVVLLQQSAITTNAQGSATGGNITIDTDILAALGDSDITANAEQNFGGRVTINAQSVLGTEFRQQLTSESDITASSNRGSQFSGTVQLNVSEIELDSGVIELPITLVDSSTQIAAVCSAGEGNEFVVTGRGGLPEAPTEILRGGTIWEDLRSRQSGQQAAGGRRQAADPPSTLNTRPSESPPVEAQGWVRDAEGRVVLVAQVASAYQPLPSDSCAAGFVEE